MGVLYLQLMVDILIIICGQIILGPINDNLQAGNYSVTVTILKDVILIGFLNNRLYIQLILLYLQIMVVNHY